MKYKVVYYCNFLLLFWTLKSRKKLVKWVKYKESVIDVEDRRYSDDNSG